MKRSFTSFILPLLLISVICFLNLSCDLVKSKDDNESPCPNTKLEPLYGCGMQNYAYTNFIVSGTASVSWRVNCQNVCTAEHSRVKVGIDVSNNPNIRVEAIILYGIQRERKIFLKKGLFINTYKYDGEETFGIKDYYGESPGEFTVLLTASFPSANTSWSEDSAFVANNIYCYFIESYYKTE